MDYQKIEGVIDDLYGCIKTAEVLKGKLEGDWYFEPLVDELKCVLENAVHDLEEL